jgi:deoxyribodipyrimidine photo-lyase
MRQLLESGWMHNRARMIAASFLTKQLGVDWRVGAAHFMRHLVDGDLASNSGGWQWAASTGTDAQPYFRVFNPAIQARRHDPQGDYVRRWVSELDGRGGSYPAPIVEHPAARRDALAAYRRAQRRAQEEAPAS